MNRIASHELRNMIRRQKSLLKDVVTVIIFTAIAVVAMINLKDWVNRSEAMRAMEHLGQEVFRYRKDNGRLPPESYVAGIKEDLEGGVRLGNLRYRALWIDFEATPNEILAYTEKNYRSSLLSDGYVVLRLDGRVQWMGKKEFEKLLAQQQKEFEIETLQK